MGVLIELQWYEVDMNGEPRLEPPGAGLRWWEGIVARWGFRRLVRTMSYERALELFEREAGKIEMLAAPLSDAQLGQQILIPRMMGIEDSSRFWSAAMVAQHLTIVDSAVQQLRILLAAGSTPPERVSIAAVKPAPTADRSDLSKLMEVVRTYSDFARTHPVPRGGLCHEHPWFGPLDQFGWHILLGVHHRIHRKQLEQIIARL